MFCQNCKAVFPDGDSKNSRLFISLMAGRLAFRKAVQINNFLEFHFLSFWLSLNSSIFLCVINGPNMCVLFIWKWRKAVNFYKFQLPLCFADKDGWLCLSEEIT